MLGLHVHKKSITACVLIAAGPQPQKCLRRFGTMTAQIRELADWLRSSEVTHVAMESTGVDRAALFEILESRGFEVCLVNARQAKNLPGRKTDVKDCQWSAVACVRVTDAVFSAAE